MAPSLLLRAIIIVFFLTISRMSITGTWACSMLFFRGSQPPEQNTSPSFSGGSSRDFDAYYRQRPAADAGVPVNFVLGADGELIPVKDSDDYDAETKNERSYSDTEGKCGYSDLSRGSNAIEDTFTELAQTGRTREREFPWQAFITVNNGPKMTTCSGTIIDDQWILTTASCVYPAYHDPNEIVVYFGVYSLPLISEGVSPSTFTIAVESVHYHPRFDTAEFSFDYALLKLAAKLDFKQQRGIVQEVCFPSSKEVCEAACSGRLDSVSTVIVGWLLDSDVITKRHNDAISLKPRRAPSRRVVVEPEPPVVDPTFSVMSKRIMQKFASPKILDNPDCIKAGFPAASVDNRTRFCVEVENGDQGVLVDACQLHPGSAVIAAVPERFNQTGVQFAICALKSAPHPDGPRGNCIYSGSFLRRSVTLYSDVCHAVDWINARYGYKRPTTTQKPKTTKPSGTTPADYYAAYDLQEVYDRETDNANDDDY